jgi:hypothetical protein
MFHMPMMMAKDTRLATLGLTGVTSNSEGSPGNTPFLKMSLTTNPNSYSGVWCMSLWMSNPIGHFFDGATDTYSVAPNWSNHQNSTLRIETSTGLPSLFYYGKDNGQEVAWRLYDPDVIEYGIENNVPWPINGTHLINGYHHYLIRCNVNETTNELRYQCFVDGVQRPLTSVYSNGKQLLNNPSDIDSKIYMGVTQRLNLMMNTGYDSGSGRWIALENNDGFGSAGNGSNGACMTQWWWDYKLYNESTTASDYNTQDSVFRSRFYSQGPMDLGPNGTSTGLAQPRHYVRLADYADLTERGTRSSQTTGWQWKKLNPLNPFVTNYWSLSDWTGTINQNC